MELGGQADQEIEGMEEQLQGGKAKGLSARQKYNPPEKRLQMSETVELAFIVDDIMMRQMRSLEMQREVLNNFIKVIDPKGKKRIKRGRDPNKPKRNKAAYILYCDDWRQANPTMPGNDSLKMGEAWRSLKENEKAIYFEKALTEKDVYDKQYAVYKATLGIPGVAAEGEDSDSENDEQKNQNGNGNSSSTIPSIGDIVGDISGSQGAKKKKLNNKGRATNNNSSSSSNV